MLHPLGFFAGAPGTGFTGARPLPHVNDCWREGRKNGSCPVQGPVEVRPWNLDRLRTHARPIGCDWPRWCCHSPAYSMDPVGIASIPICPPGKVPCSADILRGGRVVVVDAAAGADHSGAFSADVPGYTEAGRDVFVIAVVCGLSPFTPTCSNPRVGSQLPIKLWISEIGV